MNRYNITIVAIIPTYLIHVSARLRLSIGLSTEFESPTVFKTSKALRCALYEFQKDNVNDIVSGKPQIFLRAESNRKHYSQNMLC